MKKIAFIFSLLLSLNGMTQYAPDADTPGTNAIHKDSAVFVSWASDCIVERGFLDIANPSFEISGNNKASFGDPTNALGIASGDGANVVSLGDRGTATLTFDVTISNGPGWDFAVFENSFSNDFLELAVVEVSSNGSDFVRFPAYSETPVISQTGSFGSTDPTKIKNLAGKYKSGYGTPFDLEELSDSSAINISAITHIRIIDVVGTLNGHYGTYDANNNLINDPYPTAFESGGFDLDGVGVIHTTLSIKEMESKLNIQMYPNPVKDQLHISSFSNIQKVIIRDYSGKQLMASTNKTISTSDIPVGVYLVEIHLENQIITKQLVKSN